MSGEAAKGRANAVKDLELIKISIRARIEDYDNFYKLHFTDGYIGFFEKQKFRLRRLLFEATEVKKVSRELEMRMGAEGMVVSTKRNSRNRSKPHSGGHKNPNANTLADTKADQEDKT